MYKIKIGWLIKQKSFVLDFCGKLVSVNHWLQKVGKTLAMVKCVGCSISAQNNELHRCAIMKWKDMQLLF